MAWTSASFPMLVSKPQVPPLIVRSRDEQLYMVGWTYPVRGQKPLQITSKYNSKLGFAYQNWLSRFLGGVSSWSHSFLIQTPNWTFYICISIAYSRGMQWWNPSCHLKRLPKTSPARLFVPYHPRTIHLLWTQLWLSAYAPLFLVKLAY